MTAVELQPRLADLAQRNADENQLSERVTVMELDLADPRATRAALSGASFDLVTVAIRRFVRSAKAPPTPTTRRRSRATKCGSPSPTSPASRAACCVPGGRAVLVYPAERLGSLLAALEREGLRPLRLRCVHAKIGEPAKRVLVEARKGARGNLVVEAPLILRDETGDYTEEAKRALGERQV